MLKAASSLVLSSLGRRSSWAASSQPHTSLPWLSTRTAATASAPEENADAASWDVLLQRASQGNSGARRAAILDLTSHPEATLDNHRIQQVNEILRLCAEAEDMEGGQQVISAMESRHLSSQLDFEHLDALFRYFPNPSAASKQ